MIKKYSIADFKLSVCFDGDKVLEESLNPYECDFDGDSEITITIEKTSEIIENVYLNVSKITDGKFYCNHHGKDCIIYYDDKSEKIMSVISFSKDYSQVNIVAFDMKQVYEVSDERYIFNLLGSAFHYIMRMHGAVVFHSSAVSFENEGVVFSAVSGTGKTTHTTLWQREYPGVVVVNDDMPVIRVKSDGEVLLCGTPWAGTTGINSNIVVPLKAVVFLSRGEKNIIVPVSVHNAIQKFFDGLIAPLTAVMLKKTVDTVNSIFDKVMLLSLSCNMNPDAARVSKEHIFGA